MEQKKLAIRKNETPAPAPTVFWSPSSFWSPASVDPFAWNADVFADTHRNMAQMLDGFLENFPAMRVQPAADVSEDRKAIRIKMDVPGLVAEDIDISTADGLLTISGDKEESDNGTESRYSFSYSTSLPADARVDQANVRLANHRLSIEIPKKNGGERHEALGKTHPAKHAKQVKHAKRKKSRR